ncbi:MAG: tRNA pseudouridine(13) synthase TruD [Myxococcales bacterium]|nr:tRNA pseudouridine(13) synthase TruD [Polyangiaceae bacterium]MDW8248817.1 tRNA pseudouridine(13) synthase TruD [Myxococcales bacterium]
MIRALLRSTLDDFQVDELPAYTPSGVGEHLYIHFRKRGLDTFQAVRYLANRLGVSAREAGTAGLKDRHAVTTQYASFPFPLARPLPSPADLTGEGIEVLSLARHGHKLKTGHLRGNRFLVKLRGIEPTQRHPLRLAFERLAVEGLPNRFGSQRFGRDGDNVDQARAWLSGQRPPPRDLRVRRLQFSALQSELFHRVLDRRIADGSWNRPLPGELLISPGGGRYQRLEDIPDAEEAVRSGRLSPSGPLCGARTPLPTDEARALEEDVLRNALSDLHLLAQWKSLGEGGRRALRIFPLELQTHLLDDATGLQVQFVLPRGAYATTVVEAVCAIEDVSRMTRTTDPEGSAIEAEDPTSGE